MKTLPPLWDPSMHGPEPQHNMAVAVGLFVLFLFFTGAFMKGIFTRAIPLVTLTRSGRQALGTVVDREPVKERYAYTSKPVVEFTSFAGEHIRFADVCAVNRPEQPGEQVTVTYDPENPHGRATILDHRGAWRVLRNFVIFEVVSVVLAVGVLLDIVGVCRVNWL